MGATSSRATPGARSPSASRPSTSPSRGSTTPRWLGRRVPHRSAEGTTLRLEHVALVEDFPDKWDEFGPGAVGVGWDLSLLGLAEHLATGGDVNADLGDPAGVELIRRSSDGWRQASIDYGTPVEQAEAAAARTTAAYTGG